jgi:hypothetical protein
VFPALTALCHGHGAQFQGGDLRWGVSDQASVDHRAIDSCLAEIRRCQKGSSRARTCSSCSVIAVATAEPDRASANDHFET